jgi:CubicO group peptidase (beta-lactamase class C family)
VEDSTGVVVDRTPGSGHKYSNIGFLVVRLVLEEATGKKCEQLARELVFAPLGLGPSTVSHPLAPEWRSRWGVPHDGNGVAHARSLMPDAVGDRVAGDGERGGHHGQRGGRGGVDAGDHGLHCRPLRVAGSGEALTRGQ